jgi:hypothetical protein
MLKIAIVLIALLLAGQNSIPGSRMEIRGADAGSERLVVVSSAFRISQQAKDKMCPKGWLSCGQLKQVGTRSGIDRFDFISKSKALVFSRII